jgi:uncharacterized membrane protein YozB (DUF420 family)
VGTPVMWILLPHGLGAEVLAPLTLAAVWFVLRRTAPRHRREGPGTGGGKGR